MRVMLQNKQKPYYCMEHLYVNTEATSIESGGTYPGRSGYNPSEVRESAKEETAAKAGEAIADWCTQKSAEVVVLQGDELRGERGGLTKTGRTEC
jgi:hypothetical protein